MVFGWLKARREKAALVEADADALLCGYKELAYEEARRRAREAEHTAVVDGNRPRGHWDRVRDVIARRTGRDGLDTATRYVGH
ncbi:MAG TPA: hypothetical protein VGC77_12295 [Rhodopseudomonas sp.]|uniref:hypothetical protein n=1 Tax=Rhodopseudomonas sp. TaxID=1078 RepID=UPI002EDA5708